MDEDEGPGDESHFPAEDLEKLYRMGGLDIAARIQGSSLNQIFGTKRYVASAWYIVTEKGVKRL